MLALGVFLAVFGVKLAVIQTYGSDLPYWDQWNGEGQLTFLPWFEHRDWWHPLWLPHSEHRIAPTRLLNLGLMLAGGQWDARVQCTVNAALQAGMVALFMAWARRHLSLGWSVGLAGFLVAVFAPPIAWANLLGGFQSQFYFLIFFSIASLWCLLAAPALSARWWLGTAFSLVAIVTMGSGFLCGPVIMAVAAIRLLVPDARARDAWLTLVVGTVVTGIGILIYTPSSLHESLHAHSIGQFLGFAMRCLSWPAPDYPWLWAIVWAPWIVVAVRWLRAGRRPRSPLADFIVGIGCWILLQTAAVSYARGGIELLPAVRYGDVTGLGLPLGFASLALMLAPNGRPRLAAASGLAFAALALILLQAATRSALAEPIPTYAQQSRDYERNVREYLLTKDFEVLEKRPIPFPLPGMLRDLLETPSLRAIMPASARSPLLLPGFNERDPRGLGSRPIRHMAPGTRWESETLPADTGGWWVIETSGDIGQTGSSLRLVARDSGATLAEIAPSKPPGATWRAAYLPAPKVPAILVAETTGASSFSFSQPVVMSSLSYRTWRFAKYGMWLSLLGIVAIAGVGFLSWKTKRPALPPRS